MFVDRIVAFVRELDLPAGIVARLEVGLAQCKIGAHTCLVQEAASRMWHGVLAPHNFDVLMSASKWKRELQLARGGVVSNKDAGRELATRLFAKRDTQVAIALQRVKDHGAFQNPTNPYSSQQSKIQRLPAGSTNQEEANPTSMKLPF